MGFPDEKELKRVRRLLHYVEGTKIIGKESTKIEQFKFQICQNLLSSFIDSKMSQKEFAIYLGIDEALVSKLLRCRIESFTIDRLLKFYGVLFPDYKIVIAS